MKQADLDKGRRDDGLTSDERRELAKLRQIPFTSSPRTSLGIEWELELVDPQTRQLASAARHRNGVLEMELEILKRASA